MYNISLVIQSASSFARVNIFKDKFNFTIDDMASKKMKKKRKEMKKEITRLKGAHLGMAQFLETKSLLKIIKNAFYFTLKGLFVLIISKILSLFFVHEENQVH